MDVIDVIYDIQKQQSIKRNKANRVNSIVNFIEFNCTESKHYQIKELYEIYVTVNDVDVSYLRFVKIAEQTYDVGVEYGRRYLIGGSKKDVDYIAIGRPDSM